MCFKFVCLFVTATACCSGSEVDRLVTAGQLWYAAKQFHPFLAYKEIDWDQAVVQAIPKIRAAKNAEEFAQGVQAMLDALADPATRVMRRRLKAGTGQHRWFDVAKNDGFVVARFRPDVEPSLTILQAAGEIEKALIDGEGLVIDLRSSPEASEAGDYVQYLFSEYSPVARKLITTPLFVPGARSRYLDAFNPGFRISTDPALMPVPESKERPMVFIVNRHTKVPGFALGLQATGKAAIIFDGDGEMTTSGLGASVPLEGDWIATIRTAEIIMRDGTGVPEPSLRVKNADPIAEAVRIARMPLPPAKAGAVLPASPRPRVDQYKSGLPSPEERLVAAFSIWGTFHYLFAYPHLMDEDWTGVLRRFIPQFLSAADERNYALVVAEMVAQVRDTHAVVNGKPLSDFFGAAPAPVQVQIVSGKPVVRRVLAAGGGLQPGDVILKVDGRHVADRIRDLTPYIAASTPQSLRQRLSARLLSGPNSSKVKLLVDRTGEQLEVEVERSTAHLQHLRDFRDGEVYWLLPDNIGYADLDRLEPADVDAMFEKFRQTSAIIFDMRGYPNGTAWSIAPRLTERRMVAAASFRRPNWTAPDVPVSDVRARLDYKFEQFLPETDKWRYKGQTVVLIDERAISQSEHSCLFYRAANGSKFIGSPTTGANGDVRTFTVPGDLRISYSGHDVRHIDGRQLQRIGIQPDIWVEPTIEGIRAGRDEVLDRAVEYLKTGR